MTAPTTTADHPPIGPTQPHERIAALDILRGFALLGILIVNMPGFGTPWSLWQTGREWFPAPWDRAAEWLVEVACTGKFNAIFSFLFGVGFTLQLERAAARGVPYVRRYLRRLAILLAFGVAHGLLIWNGDVLHIYAVLGVGLMLLRRAPTGLLLALIVFLTLAPIAHEVGRLARHEGPRHPPSFWAARVEEEARVYSRGTYPEMVMERIKEFRIWIGEGEELWFAASVGGTMLLGLVAGRRRIFRDLPAHRPLARRLLIWCGGLGLACALAFAVGDLFVDHDRPTLLGLATYLAYELNRPLLSLAYISAVALLSLRPAWRGRLEPLASVGRLPLTNYLMQSVLCTTIFYAYGLGLYGKVGPAAGVGLALAIYAVQVAYSHWWVAHFRFGPLEWLWRALTYGRLP